MKSKDIFAFILSEATGLELIDIIRLLNRYALDDTIVHGLADSITREKALVVLALWNQRKTYIFRSMTRSAKSPIRKSDLS
ncbi:MAG: hypothetical protein PVF20_04575 [Desulfobacterales bacterium]|jgi:hypothetical protein